MANQTNKRSADSTSEPGPKRRAVHEQANYHNGRWGSTRNDVKDGYGKNIKEMIMKNYFNTANETFYHVTKASYMLDINFADNQSPIMIPYHSLSAIKG